VLAAILFPVFAKAREKARQTSCLNNQRQLAVAITMYTQDNGSKFMPTGTMWSSALGLPAGVFNCPSLSNFKGTGSMPAYGFNGVLFGAALGDLQTPSMCILTADYNVKAPKSLFQIADWNKDVDPRHNSGVVLSCVDGHVAYELINASPAITASGSLTLAQLMGRGYTPFDGGKMIVNYAPQFNSYCNNSYSIASGFWNGTTNIYNAPTTFTIPKGALYTSGSGVNFTLQADLGSTTGNYVEFALGAYLPATVLTTTNAATWTTQGIYAIYSNFQSGFGICQDPSWRYTAWASKTIPLNLTNVASGYFYRCNLAVVGNQSSLVVTQVVNNGQPTLVGSATATINWATLVNNNTVGLLVFSNGSKTAVCQNLKMTYLRPIPLN